MRFFASQGLAGDISDVWDKIGANFSDSFKKASTGDDGKQYFVPIYNYPWVVMYRKSLFADGATRPHDDGRAEDARRHDEEGRARPDRVRRQGRLAGDGHLRHPQHAHQRLRLPCQPDGRQGVVGGRQGQDRSSTPGPTCCPTTRRLARPHLAGGRADVWLQKKAGMYLLGTFVSQQFTARTSTTSTSSPSRRSTPSIGTDSIDAPIDGFMMASKPKNEAAPRPCWSTSALGRDAENIYLKTDPGDVGANKHGGPERLHRGAEEVGRDHRLDHEHRPVPRP